MKLRANYAGYIVCGLMVILNFFYVWFLMDDVGYAKFMQNWLDRFFFNRALSILLPIYMMILGLNFSKIKITDLMVFLIPMIIWFLLLPLGGSGVNHLIINPAMIISISGLYFLKYYIPQIFYGKLRVTGLWLIIFAVCLTIHLLTPTFPE